MSAVEIRRDYGALRKFAQARRIVGLSKLSLRECDRPEKVIISPDVITVILKVERFTQIRGGVRITHRGQLWLSFERQCNGSWLKVVVSDTTERLAEPELCLSWVEDVADQEARMLHEQMCYRPGTSNFPLDGPVRIAQQRVHGV